MLSIRKMAEKAKLWAKKAWNFRTFTVACVLIGSIHICLKLLDLFIDPDRRLFQSINIDAIPYVFFSNKKSIMLSLIARDKVVFNQKMLIFFSFLHQNIYCEYSLEAPHICW